jgi:hypothetical protein
VAVADENAIGGLERAVEVAEVRGSFQLVLLDSEGIPAGLC